jgi:hypothetical protein
MTIADQESHEFREFVIKEAAEKKLRLELEEKKRLEKLQEDEEILKRKQYVEKQYKDHGSDIEKMIKKNTVRDLADRDYKSKENDDKLHDMLKVAEVNKDDVSNFASFGD